MARSSGSKSMDNPPGIQQESRSGPVVSSHPTSDEVPPQDKPILPRGNQVRLFNSETPLDMRQKNTWSIFMSRAEAGSYDGNGEKNTSTSLTFLLRSWTWELISCLLSILTLIIIVMILRMFNGQSLPHFHFSLTLNTLVAFLATIAQAAVMFPVVESLGQWKWNWFSVDQPLRDFQTFDDASRGLRGSFGLIRLTGWRSIATLGALVSVLGIVTSPTTQQIISYPTRLAPSDKTATAVASWSLNIPDLYHATYFDSTGLSGTVPLEGLSSLPSASLPVRPACATGNCTYPRFQTLGVCMKIASITELLNVTLVPQSLASDWTLWTDINHSGMPAYNVSLPSRGAWFISPVARSLFTIPLPRTLSFPDDVNLFSTAFYNTAVIYFRNDSMPYPPRLDTPLPKYEAVEIIFHTCIHELEVGVTDAIPYTVSVASSYQVLQSSNFSGTAFECLGPTGVWNLSTLSAIASKTATCTWRDPADISLVTTLRGPQTNNGVPVIAAESYSITERTRVYLSDAFRESMRPVVQSNTTMTDQSNTNHFVAGPLLVKAALDVPDGTPDISQVRFDRLNQACSRIAVGATNLMRTLPPLKNGTANSFPINGTAFTMESYINIRWGWLAFLAGQIMVGTIFFLATVLTTSGDAAILKNSALATLSAFGADSHGAIGGIRSMEAMDKEARGFRAGLVGAELLVWKVGGGPLR